MSTSSLPLVCLLLGQLTPLEGQQPPLEPIPARSFDARPAETPQAIRFGQPTPADPLPVQQAAPAAPINRVPVTNRQQGVWQATGSSDNPDGAVVPAKASEPAAPARPLAELLIQQTLAPLPVDPVAGRSLSLTDALGRTTNRSQQAGIVKAYWNASAALADYHDAVEETALLTQIPRPQAASEDSLLSAERSAAEARHREAKLALAAARFDLLAYLSWPAGEQLPLPSDTPLTGAYRTHFDAMFRNRTAPVALMRLDRIIPLQHDLIAARAKAVADADAALSALLKDFREGRLGIATVLRSYRQRRDQRLAFLAAVRDYNRSIADYAFGVAVPGLGANEVAAMLIPITRKDNSVLVPSNSAPTLKQVPSNNLVPVEPAIPRKTETTPPVKLRDLGPATSPLTIPKEPSAPSPLTTNPSTQPKTTLPPTQPKTSLPPIPSLTPPPKTVPGSTIPPKSGSPGTNFPSTIPPRSGGSFPSISPPPPIETGGVESEIRG